MSGRQYPERKRMLNIRPMTDTDAIYLLDIDLKGSEIPLGIEEWQIIANLSNWVIFVADWKQNVTVVRRIVAAIHKDIVVPVEPGTFCHHF